MPFYSTVGYRFALDDEVEPDGSLVLASAMPMHQLERRNLDQYPHLVRRLFDPQLYMAGIDASQCRKHCAKLGSYPWFGVKGLQDFDSTEHQHRTWMKDAEKAILGTWAGRAPSAEKVQKAAARECADFQRRIGCWAAILPSPLTIDPSTSYSEEEAWLDASLEQIAELDDFNLPLFATVAVSDVCLRLEPQENQLLDIIVDAVSAREGLDGVYIVIEQANEGAGTRSCGSARTLWSVLHLVHSFAHDAALRVGVSFLGPFGLVCEAAGAEWWASNWYKSLYRLRLADKLASGRAYPLFWSYPSALDIHLDGEFDRLVSDGHLSRIAEKTSASEGLLVAAQAGRKVRNVAPWVYRQSNVAATMSHYLLSAIKREGQHAKHSGEARLEHVEKWVEAAAKRASTVETALGPVRKTNTAHVHSWLEALRSYRKLHNV